MGRGGKINTINMKRVVQQVTFIYKTVTKIRIVNRKGWGEGGDVYSVAHDGVKPILRWG